MHNLRGLSPINGKLVKIFENPARGPNSGVNTIWLHPYSPSPALIA